MKNIEEENEVESINENIYYLNIPGGISINISPDENSERYIFMPRSGHKLKVICIEETEGWKKIVFPEHTSGWLINEYLVKDINDIIPDYELFFNAVGTYYYNRTDIVREDFEISPNREYEYTEGSENDVITLNYIDGDIFTLKEVNIENNVERHRLFLKGIIPNNSDDPFLVEFIGDKVDFIEFYFIEDGIKQRVIF
jgi:hypothetical protein